MAEGGGEKDDNPYSFKKFIKSKHNYRVSSDSDTEHSEEDGAVDLLENSCPLSRGVTMIHRDPQLTALLLRKRSGHGGRVPSTIIRDTAAM